MPARLRAHAQTIATRAHVPYSRTPAGAALLLDDGTWVAAPRLENASFPLTITALQGALAIAAMSEAAPVAAALSRPLTRSEHALLEDWTGSVWRRESPDFACQTGVALPALKKPVRLALRLPPPPDVEGGAALALAAADNAHVPASAFPVGAAIEDAEGRLVVGANVELDADWTRGLCAERTALVAAQAAGLGEVRRLYVACARAPGGTPCGGCRQVIAELAPRAEVVVWQGTDAPEVTTPAALLPAAFAGDQLGAGADRS